jgi:hypothetical protein
VLSIAFVLASLYHSVFDISERSAVFPHIRAFREKKTGGRQNQVFVKGAKWQINNFAFG